ncbi:hypothetical protein LTR87_005903 [Friedmanniomyces endolithicus]|nr:hypothetical protein LTR94_005676 [Friedmanniomyces endolithicus]KAK0880302.1 hypothetical protein LTR87_005903 [Friedmanniomyces endolithicus]
MDWERAETVPPHVFATFSKHHMLIPTLPAPLPAADLKACGIHEILGVVKVEEFSYFHNLIYTDEMSRSGLAGPGASLTTGIAFGVPCVIKYGSPELRQRFLPDAFHGRTRFCIAITEPDAGSDVANIQTTAVRSQDGGSYVVNGRAGGLSLLVVPLKGQKGVTMRRMKVQGQMAGGTTFIELEDVEVPVGNLIGEEGMGMRYIMNNFNHERLTIAIGATRQSRVVLGAAFEYCLRREAFGKTLMEQPVVRHRLAKAGALLESQWAWVEQFVYQMVHMSKEAADVELGGLTAAAKANAGMVLKECADTAVLLFGGNGFTRTGQGEIAERMWREVNGHRIPGGSEDVLLDLMIRQLAKNYQRKTKELERPRGSSRL